MAKFYGVLGVLTFMIGFSGCSDDPVPSTGVPLANVASITTGGLSTCATTTSGSVVCWGSNLNGNLGNGAYGGNASVKLATAVPTGMTSDVTSIVLGRAITCAIKSGAAHCWGGNGQGVGATVGVDSTTLTSTEPVAVTTLTSSVTSISVGSQAACAVYSEAVYCWGYASASGGIGDGTTTSRDAPVITSITGGATHVDVGANHMCAVVSGAVKCWGANDSGQLGNGTTTKADSPTQVTGLTSGVSAVALGGRGYNPNYPFSCALLADGTVKCWGANDSGQLGDGTTTNSTVPVTVSGVTGATSLAAGYKHACAVIAGGAVKCWGLNDSSQLGNGATTSASTPVDVAGITGATSVAAGGGGDYVLNQNGSHTCVLLSDKSVKCWGYGADGQLGEGGQSVSTSTKCSTTPVTVLQSL